MLSALIATMLLLITTYVAASEVTTLKHELGNDSVESRASVSETLLASAESTEVLSSLRDDVIVEDKVDTSGLLCRGNTSALCGRREVVAVNGVSTSNNVLKLNKSIGRGVYARWMPTVMMFMMKKLAAEEG